MRYHHFHQAICSRDISLYSKRYPFIPAQYITDARHRFSNIFSQFLTFKIKPIPDHFLTSALTPFDRWMTKMRPSNAAAVTHNENVKHRFFPHPV
jgi:hypothetical protein